jgi:DNA-3-methyladenine glycosylase
MSRAPILTRDFFSKNAVTVAKALLGRKLVRHTKGLYVSGTIIETEAYLGDADSASHAYNGPTPRNRVMFGPPGVAYVYFIYGMHFMFNVTTGRVGEAGAVLIRAIAPCEGVGQMRICRNSADKDLTNGPAKLCQALSIDKRHNGCDLTLGERIWIEASGPAAGRDVNAGPRVGIPYARPAHRKLPWRFWCSVG